MNVAAVYTCVLTMQLASTYLVHMSANVLMVLQEMVSTVQVRICHISLESI